VNLLLDTHVLLWAAGMPEKLSESARSLLRSPENALFFSSASIWEIVIKCSLGRADFKADPARLMKLLVSHGYTELPVTGEHVLKLESVPLLHKDPLDRLLIAQARAEGMQLLTADSSVLLYGESILSGV
jgi:PIN domain nuclease of toxin-antitoxin system